MVSWQVSKKMIDFKLKVVLQMDILLSLERIRYEGWVFLKDSEFFPKEEDYLQFLENGKRDGTF